LVALTDALVRVTRQPALDELDEVFQLLRTEANAIRRRHGTLFGARAFRDLVVVAVGLAPRLRPSPGRRRRHRTPTGRRRGATARSTSASSRRRPTICSPTGRPLAVHPAGTETAGWPL